MKTIIILTLTIICLSAKAQSQMTDIQMNDSIMKKMEIQYGKKQQWKHSLSTSAPQQSMVVRRQNTTMTIDPNVRKITMPMTTCSQQSVFSRKDDMMWAKDYTIGTFLSDILIGK